MSVKKFSSKQDNTNSSSSIWSALDINPLMSELKNLVSRWFNISDEDDNQVSKVLDATSRSVIDEMRLEGSVMIIDRGPLNDINSYARNKFGIFIPDEQNATHITEFRLEGLKEIPVLYYKSSIVPGRLSPSSTYIYRILHTETGFKCEIREMGSEKTTVPDETPLILGERYVIENDRFTPSFVMSGNKVNVCLIWADAVDGEILRVVGYYKVEGLENTFEIDTEGFNGRFVSVF